MHLKTGLLARFGQRLEEILPIHIIQENVLSPVAPTHHMVNRPGILDSNLARHDSTMAELRTTLKAKAMV